MKEETKQKLNEVKEFVHDNKKLIENGLWFAGCFVLGHCIGNGIANTINSVYNKGFDQGMNCCFNLMMNENAENSEVLKALVDFNIKHCENH
jgi:hypothetical protein